MAEGAGGALSLTGDVIAAGTALAGLVLVYLGSVSAGYASYERDQQRTVRAVYQRKAWFAVGGILLSILASGIAVLAKWSANDWIAGVSIIISCVRISLGRHCGRSDSVRGEVMSLTLEKERRLDDAGLIECRVAMHWP